MFDLCSRPHFSVLRQGLVQYCSCYIAELLIILLSPSVCWDCRYPPLPLVDRHTSAYQHDRDNPCSAYTWFSLRTVVMVLVCEETEENPKPASKYCFSETFTLNKFMLLLNNNTILLFIGCFRVIKDSVRCIFSSRFKHGTIQSCTVSVFFQSWLTLCMYM